MDFRSFVPTPRILDGALKNRLSGMLDPLRCHRLLATPFLHFFHRLERSTGDHIAPGIETILPTYLDLATLESDVSGIPAHVFLQTSK
jgi:hypothetical protein